MERHQSQAVLVSSALLGVLAVAAFVSGVFVLFGSWILANDSGGSVQDIGAAAAAITGAVTLAFASLAGFAAHDEWLGRPRGRVLGLAVAVAGAIGAAVPLLVGKLHGTEPLFYIAIGLAVVTAIALLIPEHTARSTGR
jgi:hypothetical protein